jgi:hypothetical protein
MHNGTTHSHSQGTTVSSIRAIGEDRAMAWPFTMSPPARNHDPLQLVSALVNSPAYVVAGPQTTQKRSTRLQINTRTQATATIAAKGTR